jgi:hypothetical protein
VLSRVFAFDWVPSNTISFLLRRLVGRVRHANENVRVLLTYVNPNLGFTGASYRGSNWSKVAVETGTRYAYLDGDYVTDRELGRIFGTTDEGRLRARLGERLSYSRMPLQPLSIYAYAVDRHVGARLRVASVATVRRESGD